MLENSDKVMEVMSVLEGYSFKVMQILATILLVISFSAHAIVDCIKQIRRHKLSCRLRKPTK